jgi:hypothetical protein
MQYDEYLARGYGIGSGAVESSHKQVVHARLRQAGMRWSVRGAQHVLALRRSVAPRAGGLMRRAGVPADLRARLEQAHLDTLALLRALDHGLGPHEAPTAPLAALANADVDCAEALWALDQPPGVSTRTRGGGLPRVAGLPGTLQ